MGIGRMNKIGPRAALIMLCSFCIPLFTGACSPGEQPPEEAVVMITLPPEELNPGGAAAALLLTPVPGDAPAVAPDSSPVPAPSATPRPEPTPSFPLKTFKYDPEGYVTAREVKLREGPGVEYAVIQEMGYNATITLLAESGEWYLVALKEKGIEGFISQDFVELGKPGSPTPSPGATKAPKGNYSDEDIRLTARMVHLEAGSASKEELRAIANVLLNRVASRKFPNSVEGNIFAKGQFSVASDRERFLAKKPSKAAIRAAEDVLNGGVRVLPKDVLYFRTKSKGTQWSSSREYYDTIGDHCFFK